MQQLLPLPSDTLAPPRSHLSIRLALRFPRSRSAYPITSSQDSPPAEDLMQAKADGECRGIGISLIGLRSVIISKDAHTPIKENIFGQENATLLSIFFCR